MNAEIDDLCPEDIPLASNYGDFNGSKWLDKGTGQGVK